MSNATIPATIHSFTGKQLNSRRFTHCVFTLAWSFGGPAAYAIALQPNTRVTGTFVAMSVFNPDQLPDLQSAQGRPFYLLHSPEDFIPMRFPEQARDLLQQHGALVRLQTYKGGHGWRGDVFGNIRTGMVWLEENTGKNWQD